MIYGKFAVTYRYLRKVTWTSSLPLVIIKAAMAIMVHVVVIVVNIVFTIYYSM